MALYEVVLTTEFMGQECINRWNYVSTGTPAAVSGSFGLVYALGGIYNPDGIPSGWDANKLMSKLASNLAGLARFVGITAKNVYDVFDFYDTPFIPELVGANTGTAASPALAFGWTTSKVRADVRRGQKRITGVTEGQMDTGGSIGVGSGSWMATIAEEMSAVQVYDDEGNAITYTPAICGKLKYETPASTPTKRKYAYKYYPDLTAQLEHTAVGVTWTPKPFVRTQTSRQYGRGR